jgi:hypothetical protein
VGGALETAPAVFTPCTVKLGAHHGTYDSCVFTDTIRVFLILIIKITHPFSFSLTWRLVAGKCCLLDGQRAMLGHCP